MSFLGKTLGGFIVALLVVLFILASVAPLVFVVFLVLKLCSVGGLNWGIVFLPLASDVGFWTFWGVLCAWDND